MAVGRIWDSDWLRMNSQRSYPLMDGCTALDITGSFTIPDSFLLDMCFVVGGVTFTDPTQFCVGKVTAFAGGYVVTLSYGSTDLASCVVTRAGHTWGKPYALSATSEGGVGSGWVSVGNLAEVDDQPVGIWSFLPAATMLQPRCVIPAPVGLYGVRVSSGGALSATLSGVITLQQGVNSRLRVTQVGGAAAKIIIDATGSTDYATQCACSNLRALSPCIRTINGVSANPANDDFTLTGGDCVGITSVAHGLSLSDTCSKPCCGCAELQVVTAALQSLGVQYDTLSSYAAQLGAKQTQIDTIISQSLARFPDSGA